MGKKFSAVVLSGPQVCFPFGDGRPEVNIVVRVDEITSAVLFMEKNLPAVGETIEVVLRDDLYLDRDKKVNRWEVC